MLDPQRESLEPLRQGDCGAATQGAESCHPGRAPIPYVWRRPRWRLHCRRLHPDGGFGKGPLAEWTDLPWDHALLRAAKQRRAVQRLRRWRQRLWRRTRLLVRTAASGDLGELEAFQVPANEVNHALQVFRSFLLFQVLVIMDDARTVRGFLSS